ncbi:MAG: hypothetical protein ACOVQ7_15315 [Limnoraphis robusta]|jgi:hypothetical protein
MSREDSRYSRRFSGEMNRDQQKTSAPKSLHKQQFCVDCAKISSGDLHKANAYSDLRVQIRTKPTADRDD